eukprot:m.85997 g.85997  ORF g.85997 m.85997 type:complete len:165 (-) comp14757_c0_seq2:60-554(-)
MAYSDRWFRSCNLQGSAAVLFQLSFVDSFGLAQVRIRILFTTWTICLSVRGAVSVPLLILCAVSIFVAFILEAFLMQLELVSGDAPDELYLQLQDLFSKQQAETVRPGERFSVKPRQKSADVIYHQLFGDEVEQTVLEIEQKTRAAATGEATNTTWYTYLERDV